ncbi:hypothetical protein E2C01_087293 [Portunus trituberculatus]|uniref:Uncharacterized protein n=1 Tax=Portunus trituberculatus TaxID=210409 RepID=A0A5B7JFS7_PORTR|nr:hypothetical protein [Portunus trituberculatus]
MKLSMHSSSWQLHSSRQLDTYTQRGEPPVLS